MVLLGNTGIRTSRLAMGTGTIGFGHHSHQTALGVKGLSELLLKAVRSLPQEEQDAVVQQLLDRNVGTAPGTQHSTLAHLFSAPTWGLMPRPARLDRSPTASRCRSPRRSTPHEAGRR